MEPVRGSEEYESAHKRKRQVLSCLPCKRRKAKCDKAHPCSTCISRREAHICEYEDGASPPAGAQQPQGFVPMDEFVQLKARLERLEQAMGPGDGAGHPFGLASGSGSGSRKSRLQSPYRDPAAAHPFASPPSSSSPQPHRVSVPNDRATDVERAFNVIEGLATGGVGQSHGLSVAHGTECKVRGGERRNTIWPSIIEPADAAFAKTSKWMRDMGEVTAAIPSKPVVEYLVGYFFSKLYSARYYLHATVFWQELAQFESLRQQDVTLSIDPAWLAQLCSLMWVSCHSLIDDTDSQSLLLAQTLGLTGLPLRSMTIRLFEALETSLACANWLFRPQVRVLQTLLIGLPICGLYYGLSTGWHIPIGRCLWFDIAVGVTKGLLLHRLGPASQTNLQPDPAFPPHLPLYTMEMARRLFHGILTQDSFAYCGTISPNPHPCFFPDGSYDTEMPGNYTQDALLQPKPSLPKPMVEPTGITFTIHRNRTAKHWRTIFTFLSTGRELCYDRVMELDRDMREDYQQLLSLRINSELSEEEAIESCLCNSAYQQRFIRLHRPFYLRSFQDDRFIFSRTTALAAARQIALNHRRLFRLYLHQPMVRDAVYLFLHHLSASIILFVQGVYDAALRPEMLDELRASSELFREAGTEGNPLFAKVGKKGYKAIQGMLRALEQSSGVPKEDLPNLIKDIERQAMSEDTAAQMNNWPGGMAADKQDVPVPTGVGNATDPTLSSAMPIALPPGAGFGRDGAEMGGAELSEAWLQDMTTLDIDWAALLQGF